MCSRSKLLLLSVKPGFSSGIDTDNQLASMNSMRSQMKALCASQLQLNVTLGNCNMPCRCVSDVAQDNIMMLSPR
jgi:hypothetical protein